MSKRMPAGDSAVGSSNASDWLQDTNTNCMRPHKRKLSESSSHNLQVFKVITLVMSWCKKQAIQHSLMGYAVTKRHTPTWPYLPLPKALSTVYFPFTCVLVSLWKHGKSRDRCFFISIGLQCNIVSWTYRSADKREFQYAFLKQGCLDYLVASLLLWTVCCAPALTSSAAPQQCLGTAWWLGDYSNRFRGSDFLISVLGQNGRVLQKKKLTESDIVQ